MNTIPRKKDKSGGITLLNFRQYYKVTVIKAAGYWHRKRYTDQWNGIERLEINPHTYGQLTFDRGGKNIQWGKDSLFSKWCFESWRAVCKSVKSEHTLTSYTKINCKQLICLNIRYGTLKLLEGNISKTFSDIKHTKVFLASSPKALQIQ